MKMKGGLKMAGNMYLRVFMCIALFVLVVTGGSFILSSVAKAATTADVTVNATGEYVAITDNLAAYNYGVVAASSTTNTTTTHIGITNSSSVQTDQTISVTAASWSSGGTGWTHDDGGSPGANTAAMYAQRGGVWGASAVIIKNAAPNYIYENCPALTDYDYGISLQAPTSFNDGYENTITVRVTAAAG